jgi:serine/threonine protein kinase
LQHHNLQARNLRGEEATVGDADHSPCVILVTGRFRPHSAGSNVIEITRRCDLDHGATPAPFLDSLSMGTRKGAEMGGTTKGMTSAAHGRFQSLTRIGAGGMGVVFAATDTRTHQAVALKLARPRPGRRRESNRQLRHEAAALALVDDPHVCAIADLTSHRGRTCLVLERLVGESLQTRLTRGRMSTLEVLDLTVQLASALRAIHAAGVVHQDIKPANVILTRDGVVKVIDFGIAVFTGAPSDGAVSEDAPERPPVLGTPNYLSPERLLRQPADPRSDLFSLGIVLYEMTTGVRPFKADSPGETLSNVLDARPSPVLELAPDRPRELARLVHRLLARHASDRYPSAAAVLRQLRSMRRAWTAEPASPRCTDRHARRVSRRVGPGTIAGRRDARASAASICG